VKALAQLLDGRWRVTTNNGEDIVADVAVNAAGYRAGEIMAMIGRTLPLVTMSHQYVVTEDVPELAARTERLPLLRDPDVSYYLRQERSGFILGPYEWRATPMWVDQIPEDFSSSFGTTTLNAWRHTSRRRWRGFLLLRPPASAEW
jgi:dimethylglycine dehydrogenase